MKKTKYSYSRCSTFKSCTLKYNLHYTEGLYQEGESTSPVTRKGIAFHEFAEHYDSKWTEEEVLANIKKYSDEYQVIEQYNITDPCLKFIDFYKRVIQKCIDEGGEFKPEVKFDFVVGNHNFTGMLDVLLCKADGTFHIIDYKTAKTANTQYYKDQLMLYTWAVAQQYGIPEEEMVNRISLSVFFPFAEGDSTKVFKTIRVNLDKLIEVREKYDETMNLIESKTWKPDPTLNKMCDFCCFAGMKDYCPLSAQVGMVPMRGTKIINKYRK